MSKESLITMLHDLLEEDDHVIFAYLYGSALESSEYRDIDIALFSHAGVEPHHLSVDIKIALHERSGLPADLFDVRIINDVIEKGGLFGLLYLRNVLTAGYLLVDKDPAVRADFLERYAFRYRECEGLMEEVLA